MRRPVPQPCSAVVCVRVTLSVCLLVTIFLTPCLSQSDSKNTSCPTLLLLLRPPFRQIHFTPPHHMRAMFSFHHTPTPHARDVLFSVRSGAVVSQDHSAVSVSTVRLGVQFRRPKAASPLQELEVRAAGGRANF
jgi:hypothetical protein